MNYDELPRERRDYYAGLFDAWTWENGLHEDGLSRHRVPTIRSYDSGWQFDPEEFLCVADELDSEAAIFAFAFETDPVTLGEASWADVYVYVWCSESSTYVEDNKQKVFAIARANADEAYASVRNVISKGGAVK